MDGQNYIIVHSSKIDFGMTMLSCMCQMQTDSCVWLNIIAAGVPYDFQTEINLSCQLQGVIEKWEKVV